jgi:hypothetical protein
MPATPKTRLRATAKMQAGTARATARANTAKKTSLASG